tara:strand:+ start:803 stop:994 length:192 start_codon:yes stop_codon:yes gene_type:complete
MEVKGVIRLKVNNEEVNFTTDCSRNTFIELTKELYAKTDIMIKSMYFDEVLTDKEFEILTSVN